MHIHPSSPNSNISEEDAAIKIQAGFRGYRVRKQLRHSTNGNSTDVLMENQMQRHNMRRCERNGETNGNRLDHSNGKSDDKEKCATTIQAGIRGFLVRKKQKVATNAATKIQAGFRGFRARKQLKNLKE